MVLQRIAGFVAFVLFFSCSHARSQTLVYSLTYAETRGSFQAHFAGASVFPGRRSDDENLSMLRGTRKTEIYSLSFATGKSTLLFSDEGPHFEVRNPCALANGGRAYCRGVWRERKTTPSAMVTAEEGVYEISLDGTNHFRKLLDAQPNQPPTVMNLQGTRAAFQSYSDKYVVSIYSVPEWKLLHTWDLNALFKAHCPACTPVSYGWLADGKRLYFQITEVGDDEEATSPTNKPGTYLLSEQGDDLGEVSPQSGAVPFAGYVHANFIEPQFLGQLPSGASLFLDHAMKEGGPASDLRPYLVVGNSDPKAQKQFPLKFSIGRAVPSPSGMYLAFIEERRTRDYRTELHLWVKNLATGEDREVYAAPPPNPPNSPEPNVNLALLGWLND
ncbi:MAG TPA: hypothetical protein VFI45_21770 [Candidatus Acidoferrum sp.]|nr:hypothetical protein [Candidatus Acidoferrum sp.]